VSTKTAATAFLNSCADIGRRPFAPPTLDRLRFWVLSESVNDNLSLFHLAYDAVRPVFNGASIIRRSVILTGNGKRLPRKSVWFDIAIPTTRPVHLGLMATVYFLELQEFDHSYRLTCNRNVLTVVICYLTSHVESINNHQFPKFYSFGGHRLKWIGRVIPARLGHTFNVSVIGFVDIWHYVMAVRQADQIVIIFHCFKPCFVCELCTNVSETEVECQSILRVFKEIVTAWVITLNRF